MSGVAIINQLLFVFNICIFGAVAGAGIFTAQFYGCDNQKGIRDTFQFKLLACLGVPGAAIATVMARFVELFIVGQLLGAVSPLFPLMYNTSQEVRNMATLFICISALLMPLHSCTNATYFMLRSGGKTIITFFFDSGFAWVISIPLAYVLSRYTALSIVLLYLSCQSLELIKSVIGLVLVKKGVWLQTIVD